VGQCERVLVVVDVGHELLAGWAAPVWEAGAGRRRGGAGCRRPRLKGARHGQQW
jgi:hypothetical protein